MQATTVREAAADPSAELGPQREARWNERRNRFLADPDISTNPVLMDLFLDRTLINAAEFADLARLSPRQVKAMLEGWATEPELAGLDQTHMIAPDGCEHVGGEPDWRWETGRAAEFLFHAFPRKYWWGNIKIRLTRRETLQRKSTSIAADLAAKREQRWQERIKRFESDPTMDPGLVTAYKDRTLVDSAGAAAVLHTTVQRIYELRTASTAEPDLAGFDSQHMIEPDAFAGDWHGKATVWLYEVGRLREFGEKICFRIWWNPATQQHEPNDMTPRHGRQEGPQER